MCVFVCLCAYAVGVLTLVRSTLANLDEADDDDECERQELGRGEEVLHSGGCLHTVAVHKRQQDCREREKEKESERETRSGSVLMKLLCSPWFPSSTTCKGPLHYFTTQIRDNVGVRMCVSAALTGAGEEFTEMVKKRS